jgi:iron complex outermembrane receptor protein
MASLWLDYTLRGGTLHGLNLGAGVRYVGRRWDDAANTQSQPGFTLFDASLRYDVDDHLSVALNATNLFDKDYFPSRAFGGVFHGEQRSVIATATYRW